MKSAFTGKHTIQSWESKRFFYGYWCDEDGDHRIETDRYGCHYVDGLAVGFVEDPYHLDCFSIELAVAKAKFQKRLAA